jgi:hypothetical protein
MKQFIYIWYSSDRYYNTDLPFIYIGSHKGYLDDKYVSSSKYLSYEMEFDNCKWNRIIINSFDLSFDRKIINDYESNLIKKAFERYGRKRCVNVCYNQFGNKHFNAKDMIKLVNPKTGKTRFFPKHLKQLLEKKGWVKTKGTTNNTVCITNGINNKFIKLDAELPEGWFKGITIRKKTNKGSIEVGHICINKDGKHKYIDKKDLEYYLMDGWFIGFNNQLKKKLKEKSIKNKKKVIKDGKTKLIDEAEIKDHLNNGWSTDTIKGTIEKGSIGINNGLVNKYIPKENTKEYLEKGWVLGCLSKKTSNKGRICINNGVEIKFIEKEELNSFLEKGWLKGNFSKKNKN